MRFISIYKHAHTVIILNAKKVFGQFQQIGNGYKLHRYVDLDF